jgi:hypothetical protein
MATPNLRNLWWLLRNSHRSGTNKHRQLAFEGSSRILTSGSFPGPWELEDTMLIVKSEVLATIATEHNPGTGNAPVLAEKHRRDEAAAAAPSA